MAHCFLIDVTFETIPDSIELIIDAIMPGAVCFVHENPQEGCWQGVMVMWDFGPDDYDMSPEEAMKETCDYLVKGLQDFTTNRVESVRVTVLDENNWFEGEVPALPGGPELDHTAEQSKTCTPWSCDARPATCNSSPKSGQLHACSPTCY